MKNIKASHMVVFAGVFLVIIFLAAKNRYGLHGMIVDGGTASDVSLLGPPVYSSKKAYQGGANLGQQYINYQGNRGK